MGTLENCWCLCGVETQSPGVLKGQGEEATVGAHVPRLDPKDSRGSGQGFIKGDLCFRKPTLVVCGLDGKGKTRGWGPGKGMTQVPVVGTGEDAE